MGNASGLMLLTFVLILGIAGLGVIYSQPGEVDWCYGYAICR